MHLRHFPLPSPDPTTPGRMVASVVVACAAALLMCDWASADWPADGTVLCTGCRARGAVITSDGAGGAFVAWTDARNSPDGLNDDVFLQRVTASGAIAPGWPVDGLAVCLAPGFQGPDFIHSIIGDGSGGVILAWRDYRNAGPAGTGADPYAQRILADGSIAPGWPVDGIALTRAPGDQDFTSVAPDGAGGAFFTWYDHESLDIYAQHLTGGGDIAPGWVSNGLPICTLPSVQGGPRVLADGAGGVFIVWADFRDGPLAQYAQRVMASGQLYPGWPENGIRIVLNRALRDLVPDGAGGAYLSCATAAGGFDASYYLQRFTGTGTIVPGWPDGGASVCQAEDDRAGLRMEADGTGGALLVWSDYRNHINDEVYALRMRSDGARDPSWPANGLPVTDNTALNDFTDLAADGQGGAHLSWVQYSFATGNLVMVQHLTGAGIVASGWPAGGLVVPTVVGSPHPHITADGLGGAILAWEDLYERARALRFAPDGPVAVELSLASAVFESGRVRLRWYGSEAASLVAKVERRTETTDWVRLSTIYPDGSGQLTYEDRDVVPGSRYGYRLSYPDGGVVTTTSETWVDVPGVVFALAGFTPNPTFGEPVVTFSLPVAGPATLELYDVQGRIVLKREVGSLGVGRHRMKLDARGSLPAGVYAIRLRQGERQALVRAVVMR